MKEYHPIEIKTTGQLVDELTIAELKVTHGSPALETVLDLRIVVGYRLMAAPPANTEAALARMAELARVNAEIWKLVDDFAAGYGNSQNCQEVQRLNAARRRLARAIDALCGDRVNEQFAEPIHGAAVERDSGSRSNVAPPEASEPAAGHRPALRNPPETNEPAAGHRPALL